MVSDNVAVDIESAVMAGWDSLLVFTGTSATQFAGHQRARFVVPDLVTVGAP